jgi:hypothetical protein
MGAAGSILCQVLRELKLSFARSHQLMCAAEKDELLPSGKLLIGISSVNMSSEV